MENMKGQTLKLKEDCTAVCIEDMGALLDVEKRCYYELNESAYFILKLIEDGCLHEDVVPGLISEFNVIEETAQADSDIFINELITKGLVEITEETVVCKSVVEPKNRKPYTPPVLERTDGILSVSAANGIVTGGVG